MIFLFQKLWNILDKKLKLYYLFLFILVLITSSIETISIATIEPVINALVAPEQNSKVFKLFGTFLDNSISGKYYLMIFSLILFALFKSIQLNRLHDLGMRLSVRIESIIVETELKRVNQRFSDDWISQLNATLTGRIDRTKDSVISGINILSSLLSIIFIISINLYVNPFFIITTFFIIALSYYLISLISKKSILNISKNLARGKFERIKITKEIVNYKKEIIINGLTDNAIKKYINNSKKLRLNEAIGDTIAQIPKSWIECIALVCILGIGIYSSKFFENSSIVSSIGILAISAQKIITYMQSIFSSVTILRSNSVDTSIIINQVYNDKNLIKFKKNEGDLVSINVRWDQIKDSNGEYIAINKGDKILIEGDSGVGKTLLIEKLIGLESNDEIDVTYTISKNANYQKSKEVPSNIFSYIPQESYLHAGSIIDNILFCQEKVKNENLEYVFKLCELEKIYNFKDCKIKDIGDSGKYLSGGQRQRVCLARAVYMDKDILLLDEATSALDGESEYKIINNLINENRDLTVLIISHNPRIKKLFKKKIEIISRFSK